MEVLRAPAPTELPERRPQPRHVPSSSPRRGSRVVTPRPEDGHGDPLLPHSHARSASRRCRVQHGTPPSPHPRPIPNEALASVFADQPLCLSGALARTGLHKPDLHTRLKL